RRYNHAPAAMNAKPNTPAPISKLRLLLVVDSAGAADDSCGSPDTVNLIVAPAGTLIVVYTWKLKFWIVCKPSSVSASLSAFTPSGRNTVRLFTGRTKGCAISNVSCFG